LEEATKRSLILIDEFGKGTCDGDGIGLFAALLHWLAVNGSPRCLAITHFHEIYNKKLIRRDLVSWWSMSVMQREDQLECFLFRVIPTDGHVKSHGLYCARLAGLPEDVIERASKLQEMYEADVPPEDLRYAKLDPAAERQALDLVRKLLQ